MNCPSYAAAFYLYTEVAMVGMLNQEVGFAILRLLLFPEQYPSDLKKQHNLAERCLLRLGIPLPLLAMGGL